VKRLEQKAKKSTRQALSGLKKIKARIFDGDAHGFLVAVYRNEAVEPEFRIRAAGLAQHQRSTMPHKRQDESTGRCLHAYRVSKTAGFRGGVAGAPTAWSPIRLWRCW
jgi:hypothetical protein